MPRHLISDAHEWINEIPTVPIYYLAKPQPRERAWRNQRGKKTLLSLTLIYYEKLVEGMQMMWEISNHQWKTTTVNMAFLTHQKQINIILKSI